MQQVFIAAIGLTAIVGLGAAYALLRRQAMRRQSQQPDTVHTGLAEKMGAPPSIKMTDTANNSSRNAGTDGEAAQQAASVHMDKPTVLIVDDQSMIRLLMKEVFETADIQVFDAENGYEALTLLVEQKIDFLLTDMKMPGMDGIEMLRRLRESSDCMNADVKCAFISAYSDPAKREEAERLGALTFFAKPFDIYAVRQFVLEQLKDVAG